MNKINITIDYNPKYNTYSVKRIEESDIILCNESNLEDIIRKILTPIIELTERAEENITNELKKELRNLERVYNNKNKYSNIFKTTWQAWKE